MVAWHAQGAAREPQARFARVRSHEDGQRKKGGRCGGGGRIGVRGSPPRMVETRAAEVGR